MVLSCPLGMISQDHEFTKTDFQKKKNPWRHQSFTTHPLQQVDQGWKKLGLFWGCQVGCCPPQTSSSMSSSCDISLSLPVSRWFFVTRRFPVFPRMVTRWGPLTTISGFITSYTRLQPCLKKVCWGCNYLI